MKVDMVADKVHMVADMKVGMVAYMKVDMVADQGSRIKDQDQDQDQGSGSWIRDQGSGSQQLQWWLLCFVQVVKNI